MGILKKIFKGVGKVFKKIGKGIKRAFKKFGKFMGKIGILGQIAMMFILPGIGNAFLANMGSWATTLGAKSGFLAKGMSKILAGAHRFGTAVKAGFNSITTAITEFGKTALNKFGTSTGLFQIKSAAPTFFGPENSAFSRTSAAFKNIGNVWKAGARDGTIKVVSKAGISVEDMANNLGMSPENLLKLNPEITGSKIAFGTELNTDLFSLAAQEGTIVNEIAKQGTVITNPTSTVSNNPFQNVEKSIGGARRNVEFAGSADATLVQDAAKESILDAGSRVVNEAQKEAFKGIGIQDIAVEKTPSLLEKAGSAVTSEGIGMAKDFGAKLVEKPVSTIASAYSALTGPEEIDEGRGTAYTVTTPDERIERDEVDFNTMVAMGSSQQNPFDAVTYGLNQANMEQIKAMQPLYPNVLPAMNQNLMAT
tara:strand:+ start:2790 stop:4058 length:1269 start_codon:yes stop_codon:yes gene_type:complete